jgi:transcriptional regulator with XRE-family HTH domain
MSARSLGPAVARALLSVKLKKLRAASEETQEEVARDCEMSLAKFARIENASSVPSKGDLVLVLRHYRVADARVDELAALAREARSRGWWQEFDFGTEKGYEAYIGYEDGASSIRAFQATVIPGLLQVPCYTGRMLEEWKVPQEAIDRAIAIRKQRREQVAANGLEQVYILGEEVILRSFGDVMVDQLEYLLTAADDPKVTIRIIPVKDGPHFGLHGPFVLLGFDGALDDVLYLENARRGDLFIAEGKEQSGGPHVAKVDNPAEIVAEYKNGFESLLNIALSPEETNIRIRQVATELSQPSQ